MSHLLAKIYSIMFGSVGHSDSVPIISSVLSQYLMAILILASNDSV